MEDAYVPEPTMVQVVLAELAKIPEAIINEVPGNTLEVVMLNMAITRALGVVERFMDITYTESDLLHPEGHTGPEVALVKVAYTEQVSDLSEQYWKMVSN